MSLNILINEFVGIIPGIGDAFSFWFKSNARNYRILQEHSTGNTEDAAQRLGFCHRGFGVALSSSLRESPSAFSSCTSS